MLLHRWPLIIILCLVSGLRIGSALADVQVNTYTTSSQSSPAVSVAADGDFVVVWQSSGSVGSDSSRTSVQGQRFASDGSAVSSQFQVNTYTSHNQRVPSVSINTDGDFVVVWRSYGSSGTDLDTYSVQGQRFVSDGSAAGGEFQVNTYTTNGQFAPSVALAADGDFVVVWHSLGSAGTDTSSLSIQGQRFASDGSAAGGEFQVNTYTTSFQSYPVVSVAADGDFVVVWRSFGSGTDPLSPTVRGQRFASDGSTVGGEFQVNAYTTGYQLAPSVSVDADGDFVVVWSSDLSAGTDASHESIQCQRFASDGSTVGVQFQVNTYTSSYQRGPSVSVDADGDFVVVWWSFGSVVTDSSLDSVQGQRFASDGSTVGGEFQVNAYTTSYQISPSVSVDADGDFVVVWESYYSGGTDSFWSIQKSEAGLNVLQRIFADGFESGDTALWSLAVH